MSGKKVLILGNGAREHALAWKIAQSPECGKIFAAPGTNPGISSIAEPADVSLRNLATLASWMTEKQIDLTVIGPEDLLQNGIVERLRVLGFRMFGPTSHAAQLETDKSFAKHLMSSNWIPSAKYRNFRDVRLAFEHVYQQKTYPLVIKAAGLAAGKGVRVCRKIEEAERTLVDFMLKKVLGGAGTHVVIEDYLSGVELSAHALCAGTEFVSFPFSQDHKSLYDGGVGPNTGGMGAYVPVPWAHEGNLVDVVSQRIVGPTLDCLQKTIGSSFTGLLYPGLMLTEKGPSVLEFNVRFGDPEAQAYMRHLKSDLLPLLGAFSEPKFVMPEVPVWNDGFAVSVTLVSAGYPGDYVTGVPVNGVEDAEMVPDVVVFHAGTVRQNGKLVTSGGRVLSVTATGDTLDEARDKAYEAVGRINFNGMHFRRDIGKCGK